MKYRLKVQSDFDRVFKKGKRVFKKSFLLVYLPAESFKIGYSVGKKHGNSVVRNRIKRLLRASAREILKGKEDTVKYYIAIVPKIKEEYSFSEFKDDLSSALVKEKILL